MKIIFLVFLILISILIVVGFIIQIFHILKPLFCLIGYVVQLFIKSVEICSSQALYGAHPKKFTHQLLNFYGLEKAYAVRFIPYPFKLAHIGFFPYHKVVDASKRARNRL